MLTKKSNSNQAYVLTSQIPQSMFFAEDEWDGVVSIATTRMTGDGRRLVDDHHFLRVLNDVDRLRSDWALMST